MKSITVFALFTAILGAAPAAAATTIRPHVATPVVVRAGVAQSLNTQPIPPGHANVLVAHAHGPDPSERDRHIGKHEHRQKHHGKRTSPAPTARYDVGKNAKS